MTLSCSCGYEIDPEPGVWLYYWDGVSDFKKLKTWRSKRCRSCNKLINNHDICVEYPRYRYPYNEVEARINGDLFFEMDYEPHIKIASHYHCEGCAEIWLNLGDIGYECLMPYEDMEKSMEEYHEIVRANREERIAKNE